MHTPHASSKFFSTQILSLFALKSKQFALDFGAAVVSVGKLLLHVLFDAQFYIFLPILGLKKLNWAILMTLALVFNALLLVLMGIIAEYIYRIFGAMGAQY